MTKILASIKNIEEAKIIINEDIDIIDLKDPSDGALGMLNISNIEKISEYIYGKKTISSTIGDVKNNYSEIQEKIHLLEKTSVDIIKIGAFNREFINTILNIKSFKKIVIVFFADKYIPNYKDLLSISKNNIYGVMIDTSNKINGCLLDYISYNQLDDFVKTANELRLLSGLAGSLSKENIKEIVKYNPKYIGFRGALCEKNKRSSNISLSYVSDIVNEVKSLSKLSIACPNPQFFKDQAIY